MDINPNDVVWDTEVISPQDVKWDNAPTVRPGMPRFSAVENRIASRPDMGQVFKQEISQIPEGFIPKVLQPYVAAFKGLSALMQKGGGPVANPLMGLQEGNLDLSALLNLAKQGITGERSGELGDIMRRVGTPEPLAALTGMGGVAGLTNLLSAGRFAPKVEKVAGQGINTAKNVASKTGEKIGNIPDKVLRGGISKPEALRIEQTYGSSNGSLVNVIKEKITGLFKNADDTYNQVLAKAPANKFINIKPAIEKAGARLKRLGLITENGNLTELGTSEIARDSTYGKLLDFYKSADAISGVKGLEGKALTQSQIIKAAKAQNQTLVNKDQFLFLRDKLNSLYKGKPSDIDVNEVVNAFYQSGESSGLKGLQQARALEREAFRKAEKFIDRKGDLKIATEAKLNRIGTDKPLSQAEMAHIRELQQYIKHPIERDAASINKLNRAKERIKNIKKYSAAVASGAIAGEIGRKAVTGSF